MLTHNNTTSGEALSFTVNDIDGKLKDGIKHCFLSTILIDTSNPPATIRANNGTIYQAIYDNFALSGNEENKILPAIASFQSWEHGNYCILRNKKG